jgi:hypothetical protein
MILISDFIPSFLRALGVDPSNIFCQSWFIAILVGIQLICFFGELFLYLGFVVIQPLSWFRSLDSLSFFSFIGTSSMMLCVVIIVIRYPTFVFCSIYYFFNVDIFSLMKQLIMGLSLMIQLKQ